MRKMTNKMIKLLTLVTTVFLVMGLSIPRADANWFWPADYTPAFANWNEFGEPQCVDIRSSLRTVEIPGYPGFHSVTTGLGSMTLTCDSRQLRNMYSNYTLDAEYKNGNCNCWVNFYHYDSHEVYGTYSAQSPVVPRAMFDGTYVRFRFWFAAYSANHAIFFGILNPDWSFPIPVS